MDFQAIPGDVWDFMFSKYLALEDLRTLAMVSKRMNVVAHSVNAFVWLSRQRRSLSRSERIGRVSGVARQGVVNAWPRIPFVLALGCLSELDAFDTATTLPLNVIGIDVYCELRRRKRAQQQILLRSIHTAMLAPQIQLLR